MWLAKGHSTKRGGNGGGGGNGLVAVAIDKDKGSQSALRCAIENLHNKGHPIILIHVLHKSSASHGLNPEPTGKSNLENMTKSLFLTFHCYCTRKDVQCYDVILEDHDVAKAITEYVNYAAIEVLVLGAPSRHTFMRKFKTDIPSAVAKGVPDFCRVYVVSKGKATLMKQASRPAPFMSPLLDQIQNQFQVDEYVEDDSASQFSSRSRSVRSDWTPAKPRVSVDDSFRSPFARGGAGGPMNPRSFQDMLETESEVSSFISSGRPSTERSPHTFNAAIDPFGFDSFVSNPRMSTSSDASYASSVIPTPNKFVDLSSMQEFSFVSQDSARTSVSSQHNMDDMEAEMKRLKLELKNTMEMYSTACKEAISAKQKAREMQRWKNEEEQKLEEAKNSEEAALSSIEEERARCKEAVETAEAAQKVAEMEAQKRMSLELKTIKDAGQLKKAMSNIDDQNDVRYRRYAMEDIEKATNKFDESKKIGEGGYGPVFKCYLDHTPVAVKVLRPDAVQGRSQFQREVEVLSMIRHPNMVLLLGACPEFGILVYEHMARGSLEDCLFRKNNVPPLSWQLRFKIAAEIATGLLFLHQTKPEPLVHRDLKPGNILLDINFVSKISDVGLARLVPAHVAENVTQQYHMTSAAGTFCYIDPEYQQTGMLGVKSDVYSFGIILLQLITARPPMGLSHLVETALENDTLADVLDKDVVDWPMEETLTFAKFALQCAELRRKDRPDLGSVVLPVLNRLREIAEENMGYMFFMGHNQSPAQSFVSDSMTQDVMSDPQVIHSGVSSKNPSPASSQVRVSMGASG